MELPPQEGLRPGAEAEQGAPSSYGARDHRAPDARGNASISTVFLQLLLHIASFLPRNEVACVLRLLCKAAAASLRGPQHTTVHLSEPSPTAEFKWRWCGPQSLRSTTYKQREQLELLTARSGVVANLKALGARDDMPVLPGHSIVLEPLLAEAAAAGRLEACRWLHEERGTQVQFFIVEPAAEGGHMDVCEWLLDHGCEWSVNLVATALRHGHVRLAEWLLQMRPQLPRNEASWLLEGAASGCDLATLQRLHGEHIVGRGFDLSGNGRDGCLAAAAGSPTPDWAAKVEWLEGFCRVHKTAQASEAAAGCPDGAARLAWLHSRGYPLDADSAEAAALAGNAEALRYVLAGGVQLAAEAGPFEQQPDRLQTLMREACVHGYLEVVQVLWDAGGRPDIGTIEEAARHGHLHIVSWAVERMGAEAVLSAGMFCAAAESGSLPLLGWLRERGCPWDKQTFVSAAFVGSLPLLRWLHERGCPWDEGAFVRAADGGCEEVLEWLVEHGCPMGEDGAAYVDAAENIDLPTLRCMARLGCPFAPDGGLFTDWVSNTYNELIESDVFDPRVLQCLLDLGCPVDWDAAMETVRVKAARVEQDDDVSLYNSASDVLVEWLERQRRLQKQS